MEDEFGIGGEFFNVFGHEVVPFVVVVGTIGHDVKLGVGIDCGGEVGVLEVALSVGLLEGLSVGLLEGLSIGLSEGVTVGLLEVGLAVVGGEVALIERIGVRMAFETSSFVYSSPLPVPS
eukprot:CAMPEP_0201911552 /NCGR_PEP_ID=MMETSP0903-20130614/2445_1 /ASSEMBLY_ACC=CAM_ASM_000552 /TAXON_ID=420261 /ORGANISM="Thalassiosira antarctica, Strain CCMP982" /LENGTH=119 /DNA_ID=CAMNT_0048446277 /DNA_START=85 /DNA_END=441 /DNA_ORIENTATION=+